MALLLVFLLFYQSLADQVCINISNYVLDITVTHGNMTEERFQPVKCSSDGFPCAMLCTPSKEIWFHGSSACLEATVTADQSGITFVYDIHEHTVCSQYLCISSSVLPLMTSLDQLDGSVEKMMKLHYIRGSCQALFRTDSDVLKAYVRLEKRIIHNIMATTQPRGGDPVTHELKFLSMNIFNISCADGDPSEDLIQLEAPQVTENESFVPEIWLPINTGSHVKEKRGIIGVAYYKEHNQFQFHQENITSTVVRIEVLEQRLENLEPPIKMVFKVRQQQADNHSHLVCRYFDEDNWSWKPDGCETQVGENNVTCSCNHATPFAVLLVIREPIAKIHWQILSYISYIGCGLSAFFCALCLLTYIFSRKHKMDYSLSIHVSLSVALFLLNSTFLLTEWGARVKPDWVCVFVAALMHYSLLCCFTWMAIEAVHLYLLLIKVYNTYYKHYLLKLSVVGWGIPAVIVSTSVGLKDFKQLYGVTQLTMLDTNQTNAICWITDDSFFYSLNLVYFTLIFIFNSGILMAVASSICRMKQAIKSNTKLRANAEGKLEEVPQRFSASCKSGLTLLGLTCLMGTTWGLAFLGSGYVNYPILYLFCILNSLQGFFIFLWVCLSARKQRKRQMEEKLSSTLVKTSGIKSE